MLASGGRAGSPLEPRPAVSAVNRAMIAIKKKVSSTKAGNRQIRMTRIGLALSVAGLPSPKHLKRGARALKGDLALSRAATTHEPAGPHLRLAEGSPACTCTRGESGQLTWPSFSWSVASAMRRCACPSVERGREGMDSTPSSVPSSRPAA